MREKMRVPIGVTTVILLAVALTFPGAAIAQCPSGAILVPTHYPTIQAAVAAAAPYDVICVGPGIYSERIDITKPVTLIGDPGDGAPGPGPLAPVIDGGGAVVDAFDLANGVHDVTITGFEIRNLAADDWTNGSGVGVQAWVPSTQNVTVSHNWFHDVGYGVMAGNDGSSPSYALGTHTGWTIADNVAEGIYSIAFELTDTSESIVRDNVIHLGVRDTLYHFGSIGVFSWAHISEHDLTISGNTIDGTTAVYPAVYIYAWDDAAPSPNLDGVVIENNLVTSAGSPYQVYVRDIGGGTVTNVRVIANDIPTLKNLTAGTVDATGNWWGQSTGPAPGQTYGPVTTSPWIVSYTDDPTKAGQPGFWPVDVSFSDDADLAKLGVLEDLKELYATLPRGKAKDKLKEAIDNLTKSLKPEYWADGSHLVEPGGYRVFDYENTAESKLREGMRYGLPDMMGYVATLVAVDRKLAQTALDEAIAAGGKADKIAQAQAYLLKGDTEYAAKKYDGAINNYKNAWKAAVAAW